VNWGGVFTPGNVKIMLLICLIVALILAVAFGVSIPPGFVTP